MSEQNLKPPEDKIQTKTMTDSEKGTGEKKSSRSLMGGLKSLDAGNARIIYFNTPQPTEKARIGVQTVFMSLVALINAACIFIGCFNIDQCPVSPEIPYYLLIKGAIGLTDIPCFVVQQLVLANNPKPSAAFSVYLLRSALFSANFAILIYGSIKVYSIYEPKYEGDEYCDELCYKIAFAVITIMWCSLGLAICCCCCVIPFYCMYLQATFGHSRNASIDEANFKRVPKN